MNALTQQLLERLWQGDPSFLEVEKRLKRECQSMSAPEAGVIGRDLILRRHALYTKYFRIAAFLASDGTAGNDGFMDFTDCVALLPEDRYQQILADHDTLVSDPVSSGFEECYLVTMVCRVFDRGLFGGEDGDDFLHYLVLGDDETDRSEIHSATEQDAKIKFPRLYAKFGHLLGSADYTDYTPSEDAVTLQEFFGADLYDEVMKKANKS
jgi:hypothetical protein